MDSHSNILQNFFDLGIIKFGDFTLKSGIRSPFYVDLRAIASVPELLQDLARELLKTAPSAGYELICGVPYAALPLATVMSIESGIPLIIKRKESKGYGTDKLIEGIFHKGQSALVVEDVITSGKSLLETIPELEAAGLKIKDIAIVIDRQQGGVALLRDKGYRVHVLFTIEEVIAAFRQKGLISPEKYEEVRTFLATNSQTPAAPRRKTLAEKKSMLRHPVAQRLLDIALRKQTNLICSADVTTKAELLHLAEATAPHIAALKIHADIIEDFDEDLIRQLKHWAQAGDFVLFEDRKFADIGNTAALQFTSGVHKISAWAEMVTAHVTAGEASVIALKNAAPQIAIVPIVQMSTRDSLTDKNYSKKATRIAAAHPDAVIGAVAQSHPLPANLLKFTPGINLSAKGDDKGQNYNPPEVAFAKYHTDFVIVGRGIYQAPDPAAAAEEYKKIAWQAANEKSPS